MNEWTVALKGTPEPDIYNGAVGKYASSVLHHIHNGFPVFAVYVREKDQWICHYCYEAAPENYGFLAELLNCTPKSDSMKFVHQWHESNERWWKEWFPDEQSS